MKIRDIINEAKVVKYDDELTLHVYGGRHEVQIVPWFKGQRAGYVSFERDGKTLIPNSLYVVSEFERKGIASRMYDYVKSLGYAVKRSTDQTYMGKAFWDKHRGEGSQVWEQEETVDEGSDRAYYEGIFDRFRKNPTTSRHGFDLEAFGDQKEYQITASVNGETIGRVLFDINGKTLIAKDLMVNPAYRGKGVSKIIYDWAKDLGYTLQRSSNQTDAGKRFWDKNRGEEGKIWEQEETVDEMALSKYQTFGDFDKPGSFTGVDKKLVPHPKNIQKATKFFEQTPYDFRLFFANISGLGKYRETGPMSSEQIRKIFNKEQADEIINGSEDAITVIYVNNVGDRKVMMTPWIMAHRFGHAIQAGARGNRWSAWSEVEKHFFSQINQILVNYYGIPPGAATRRGSTDEGFRPALNAEYNALFNAIGTQRSSRERQINRPYEFMYEMFAQYLKTGTVTLNPLPNQIPYGGRMVFGKPSRYLTLKPDVRNDPDTQYVTDTLGNDMGIMFGDVLSSAVDKIYVM